MLVIAALHILCEDTPSLGTAVVNGLLAWATVLGGFTACGSGLPAALFALDTTPARVRADLINRGLGLGFRIGTAAGLLTFVLFVARVIS
ncbi:MAG TPA: hypothetical protein VG147_17315 [Solirubrobacteraceae bacterium]|nr:hypothetical protein [Solirubrobacteraceae bacterium]